ncbi:MAG: DUF3168 domain-containing protein [Hyphomicrobiaceae bacterium]|nr:DUF3168 domain-containing protein [Hyphomicrobiaceae bacterium]
MMSSQQALQQAVFVTLTASSVVTSLLGGARIFDDVPQPQAFPYITFGQSSLRDYSSATEAGDEHLFTLHVWSRATGRRETMTIADAVKSTLHDQSLPLTDHRLINLRHEFSEARRDPDGETIHGVIRFRAVTEPL